MDVSRWLAVQIVRLPNILVGANLLVMANNNLLGQLQVRNLLVEILDFLFKPT